MPRALWTGAISFGLVNVPVRLTTAVSKKDVRFHQLHADDGARIELKRTCTADGEELSWGDLVKGYEIAPGQHVVIKPEELEALDPDATRTIDVVDFVEQAEVDPVYFQHPYYLVPQQQSSEKAYALLREAMVRSGKVAVARFVMRSKEYLALIRPKGEALVLSTMLFGDEVVPESEIEGLPSGEGLDERELKMAEQLIDQLTVEFEPQRYEDRYRERVMALIEAKAAGEEVVTTPASEEQPAGVVDLVAALEASLQDAEKSRKQRKRRKSA